MFNITKPTVDLKEFVPLSITNNITHLSYTFYIKDISRCLLQELARHRTASLSVKSTRYTLKELKDEDSFCKYSLSPSLDLDIIVYENSTKRASKYLVFTGYSAVDRKSILSLEQLRLLIKDNIRNDLAKYCLPESYKTELTWTINGDGLENFLKLRTDRAALWEIRNLAYEIYNQLPDDHKELYKDVIYKEEE